MPILSQYTLPIKYYILVFPGVINYTNVTPTLEIQNEN